MINLASYFNYNSGMTVSSRASKLKD